VSAQIIPFPNAAATELKQARALIEAVRSIGGLDYGPTNSFEIAFQVRRVAERAGLGTVELRPLLAALEQEKSARGRTETPRKATDADMPQLFQMAAQIALRMVEGPDDAA
jgi:hypothetical protein